MAVERAPRRLGQQDLPAMSGLADPRRAMDIEAEVALRAHRRPTGVHADSNLELDTFRPVVLAERLLSGDRGVGCSVRLGEDDEELVAAPIDHLTTARRDGVAQQTTVVVEDGLVVVAELMDETRRPLDVREEQRDCSMR